MDDLEPLRDFRSNGPELDDATKARIDSRVGVPAQEKQRDNLDTFIVCLVIATFLAVCTAISTYGVVINITNGWAALLPLVLVFALFVGALIFGGNARQAWRDYREV